MWNCPAPQRGAVTPQSNSQSHAGAATCGATAPAGRKWSSWQGNLHFPPFYLLCFLNPRKGCTSGMAELHPILLSAPKNKRPIHSSPSLRAALTPPELSKTERERRLHSPSRPYSRFSPLPQTPGFKHHRQARAALCREPREQQGHPESSPSCPQAEPRGEGDTGRGHGHELPAP